MKKIKCSKLKADSYNKTDITVKIHDLMTGLSPALGFSIKSQLGHPATLLNAGKTTNFVYNITGSGLTDKDIEEINHENGPKKRIIRLKEKKCFLKYLTMQNKVFENNLVLIDSLMPKILSDLLLEFYSSDMVKLSDLCEAIKERNVCGFDMTQSQKFYEYKIKHFLTDVALGMMRNSLEW